MNLHLKSKIAPGFFGLTLVGATLGLGTPAAHAGDPVPPTLTCPAGSTAYGPASLTRMAVLIMNPRQGENLSIPLTGLSLKTGDRLNIARYLSWDGYENRASSAAQLNEKWAVRAGTVVSAYTEDIPDGVTFAETTGSLGSIVATADAPVDLVHHGLLNESTIFNSVFPIGVCLSVDSPFDLKVTKALTSTGPFQQGSSATFRMVVTNNGPGTASGWEMIDVVPTGLTPTAISPVVAGSATCTLAQARCVSTGSLAPGASVAIDMTGTVGIASGSLRNVVYVDKAPGDLAETNPLGTPPTSSTDTAQTPTNNDAEASLTVVAPTTTTTTTTATSTTTSTSTTTPTASTTTVPTVIVPVTPGTPSPAPAAPAPAPAAPAPAAPAPAPAATPTTSAPTTTGAVVAGVTITTAVPTAPVAPSIETEGIAFTGSQNSAVSLMGAIFITLGAIFLVGIKLRKN